MALTTWTPSPVPTDTLTVQTRANIARLQFGDGYTARLAGGINSLVREVQLNWRNISQSEKDALVAFLEARGGQEAFLYTLPTDATEYAWTSQEWTVDHVKGTVIYNLTATLVQEFDHG
jgi:phage-related protein